jgi:membrane peptidoglycan carboxypeptidase
MPRRRANTASAPFFALLLALAAAIALCFAARSSIAARLRPRHPRLARMLAAPATAPAVSSRVRDARENVAALDRASGRAPLRLAQVPPALIAATIATEDRAFYRHHGIDIAGMARAAAVDAVNMRTAQGGSTITQQLARNLFLTQDRTFSRKFEEIQLALELEREYDKRQILEMYLDRIYFGEGAYGVRAAASTYMAAPLQRLSLAQCALLAGIPANPSLYAPTRHPDLARARRAKVLRNMLATGAIDEPAFTRAMREPLGLRER